MKRIINTLMRRDGLSKEEAEEIVNNLLDEVHYHIEEGEFEKAEETWERGLGLEMDYLMEVLI